MAIALESDFRSLKTGPLPEVAERAAPPSGRGEAFASQLRQEHGAESPRTEKDALEAANIPYGALVIPLHTAEFQTIAAPVVVSTAVASPSAPDARPPDIQGKLTAEEIAVPESPAHSARPGTGADTPEVSLAAAAPPDLRETASPAEVAEPEIQKASTDIVRMEAPTTTRAAPAAAPAGDLSDEARAVIAAAPPADASLDLREPASPTVAAKPEIRKASTDIARTEAPTTTHAATAVAPAGDVSGETLAVVAAVTPATARPAAAPERPTVTGVATIQAAKADPKTSEPPQQTGPAPLGTGSAAPEIVEDGLRLVTDTQARSDTASPAPAITSPVGLASAGPAAAPATAPAASAVPMTPVQAVITTSPAQIVNIVAQSAENGQSDRIVVQLDPPELGRVSIDFKFDAAGLQHVTITGETPEAMRQLRQMHFELVQSLERQGLSGQNMTFQHQQQNTQQAGTPARPAVPDEDTSLLAASALRTGDLPTTPRTPSGGRLDIRL